MYGPAWNTTPARSHHYSTIQGLQEDARRLDHGKGIPGFLKSVVHKSRDEGVISGMKARLVVAIQAFQVVDVTSMYISSDIALTFRFVGIL